MRNPKVLEGMGHADRLAKAINYVRHLRANTLEQVITALELCTVGDLLERHSLSAALSRQYSRDILTNHIKLINLEEIQTKIDIAQYDLHYASLRPERKEVGDRSLTVRVKMHVRGSSENRPKITLGSQVLLRPVAEDIQLLPTFGWAPQLFELRGICVHYQLSTEEATFEFPIVTLPHDVLFTRLRFHVRFDYSAMVSCSCNGRWATSCAIRILRRHCFPTKTHWRGCGCILTPVAMPRHLQLHLR
jgi:hypothetical protein